MRHTHFTILVAFFLSASFLITCNKTSNYDEKNQALIEKENELLKKENALLKKEQALKQDEENPNTVVSTMIPQSSPAIPNNLDFLKSFNEKYPYEIKLLEHTIIKKRLRKMLGSQYEFMKSIWEVEIPIKISNGYFYVWGMQAHSGGDPSAALMADLNKNVLYVKIRKDNQDQFYSEDGSALPPQLKDWANEQ